MRLKEIRLKKGLEQKFVAEQVGTDAPMFSKFENYRCLPIPEMLKRITDVLECSIEDIYLPSEVIRYTCDIKKKKRKSNVYRLTAELPSEAKKFLHSGALQACGFKNIYAWINWCYRQLRAMYIQNAKTTDVDKK